MLLEKLKEMHHAIFCRYLFFLTSKWISKQTSINAFKTGFADVQTSGVYNTCRKLFTGLAKLSVYSNFIARMKKYIRTLATLSFVAGAEVTQAFEPLTENFPEQGMPVADYLEDNYIGRLLLNR